MDSPAGNGIFAELMSLNLIGNSPAFRQLVTKAKHIAQFDVIVSIYGETGSGKEVLAEAIHYCSPRSKGPFIPVNCGALTDSLLESELFGHEKGAFTNAYQSHCGLVEQAEKGTLFLDELEALSPRSQVTLLRFLQNAHYRRVGGKTQRFADVRVITATNIPLQSLKAKGQLREDLFYRLNVVPLNIPPLRERQEDIPALIHHFMRRHKTSLDLTGKKLSDSAYQWMLEYSWPGNVRELENIVLRGLLSSTADHIALNDLLCSSDNEVVTEMTTDSSEYRLPHQIPENHSLAVAKQHIIAQFEQHYLSETIRKSRGNVSQAARLAGKERRAFGKLLKKYAINPRDFV